jgi:A/G-specific adenine glycosylase
VCAAYAADQQANIPLAKPRIAFTELHEVAVVVQKGTAILLRQCEQNERWAGLWDFPRFAIDAEGPLFAREEIVNKVQRQTGVKCQLQAHFKTVRHSVTRYRITLDCFRASYASGRMKSPAVMHWVELPRLSDYPLSTTGRKIAKSIQSFELK